LSISCISGQCVRINTGAPVPAGADSVVQVEDTRLVRASGDGKVELEIEILKPPSPGEDIRPVGSDIAFGSKVLPAKSRLGAAEVGLLAAVGAVEVEVFKLPKVALLSTGDEVKTRNFWIYSNYNLSSIESCFPNILDDFL
jgi:gephyrin